MARSQPRLMSLKPAVGHIKDACDLRARRHKPSPFFFLVGAGISHPPVPRSAEIIEHCRTRIAKRGELEEVAGLSAMSSYSHWFERAAIMPSSHS